MKSELGRLLVSSSAMFLSRIEGKNVGRDLRKPG